MREKVIIKNSVSLTTGVNNFPVDVSSYANGMYCMKIISLNNDVNVIPFVVAH